jgi:plasmid stability protein
MTAIIQVRNVPKDVHRALKAKAVAAHMSLSEFLCLKLTELARQQTLTEVLERIAGRPATHVAEGSAAAVRRERDARR